MWLGSYKEKNEETYRTASPIMLLQVRLSPGALELLLLVLTEETLLGE